MLNTFKVLSKHAQHFQSVEQCVEFDYLLTSTRSWCRRNLQELLEYTGIMKTDVKLHEFDRLLKF